jgi:hypothetical protein
MKKINNFTAFAVEPNPDLTNPYLLLPSECKLELFQNLPRALKKCISHQPDLFCLSASLPPEQILKALWMLKDLRTAHQTSSPIPLLLVIDWTQPIIRLPGTTWGGKIGVMHSLSSAAEIRTTVERLMSFPSFEQK